MYVRASIALLPGCRLPPFSWSRIRIAIEASVTTHFCTNAEAIDLASPRPPVYEEYRRLLHDED
jgi:hypothetical protein